MDGWRDKRMMHEIDRRTKKLKEGGLDRWMDGLQNCTALIEEKLNPKFWISVWPSFVRHPLFFPCCSQKIQLYDTLVNLLYINLIKWTFSVQLLLDMTQFCFWCTTLETEDIGCMLWKKAKIFLITLSVFLPFEMLRKPRQQYSN
jgi:hypothetical protein